MEKGTIIYVGGFELPDKNAAAHRVINNGKIFNDYGYKVVYIGIDKKMVYKNKNIKLSKETANYDYWLRAYPKSQKDWLHYLCEVESIKRVMENYTDVKAVICYNYQSFSYLRLMNFCKKLNIKVIADCTEWYSTKGENFIFKMIKGTDSFVRMKYLQKKSDGLILISEYLMEYYKRAKNIVYLPPLVDLDEAKWFQDSPDIINENINIVYAGSPGKNKDKISYIIDRLYDLKLQKNYIFNIVGITKEQYIENNYKQRKIIEDLSENIIFHGRVTHNESLNFLKNADFSMFIRENTRSNSAGFPTKFVESLSIGTPIITNETSDLKNYLKTGKNGFYLDIEDNLKTKEQLNYILSLDKNEIQKLKNFCVDNNYFYYKKYIKDVKNMANLIG